jgi:hypothetical protein
MRTKIASIAMTAVILAAGCGGGQKKVAGFKKGPMPPGFTWTGKYYCHAPYEEMNLTQTGSTVVGTVEYKNGRIEGTADGNILVFTWSQEAGHSGLTGSTTRISGKGVFQYKVEETQTGKENHNLYGQWGYDDKMTGGGKWECYKSRKDIRKVKKTMLVDEESAVEAAAEEEEEDEEGETKIKDVGVKEKKKEKPTYEDYGKPETADERLEELDDLDF